MSINQAPVLTTADANGIVTMDFGSFRVTAPNAVQQVDGKIVIHGYAWNTPAAAFYSVLVRYNTDGSLDTTFGTGGVVTSNTDFASFAAIQAGVALQADGKIVVGNDGFAVARYNSDGSFDTSFGTGGSVPALETGGSLTYGVVVEPDGKIVASGASGQFGLARFDSSGNLDPSFGVGGKATASFGGSSINAHSLVAQPDGKLLVAGSVDIAGDEDFALVRYNTDGSLDATFGTGGKVTRDFSSAGDEALGVALQADGKIVVAGTTTTTTGVLVRYNANGVIDSSFGIGGEVTTDAASSVQSPETVKIQSDGKIVVAGYSSTGVGTKTVFAVARYNSDGSLDGSFGSGGKVLTDIGATLDHANSIVIEPDGKILVVGTNGPTGAGPTDLGLVRYNSDGSLDTSFGNGAALNGLVFFIEDGSPTPLNARAIVHDTELDVAGSYAGASLTLARHGGANSEDVFGASGNLSALSQGGDITLSGVAIGTVTQNSGGVLVLTFGAAATEARVDETMRAITYKDASDTPAPSVQIDWSFSDGNTGAQGDGGALAATGLTTVKITAVNDAPVNTAPGGPLSAVADTDFAIAGLSVSDPDSASLTTDLRVSHGTLTVAAVGGAAVSGSGTAWVDITGSPAQIAATLGASHNVLYHSAADFSGADALSMITSDGPGLGGQITSSSVALNVTAVPGAISIDDVTISEGDSGTKVATFTVMRDGTAPIAVDFATADGSATTADNDYVATSGTLNFAAGVKTQNISVTINGDTKVESDEAFSVNLSNATNGATISHGSGTGTITNDDSVPSSVSINDVTISEGNSGSKLATFTVTRSGGAAAFDVNFTTADGSATQFDHDYVGNDGTLHFGAGVNTQTISVTVNGDSKVEPDETFFVKLSGATNGVSISDGQGIGTITNDDVPSDLTASIVVLDRDTISYRINNIGAGAAAASTAGIFASTDTTITTSDTLVGGRDTPALAAGASDLETARLGFFLVNLTPGTYFVGAVADYNGQIAETNETNNASSGVPIIIGDNSANIVNGTAGNDIMLGLGGNDILHGGGGNDTIDGGGGEDTAVFSGNLAAYTLHAVYTAQDRGERVLMSGPDGSDTVFAAEHLQFDDGTINYLDGGDALFDTVFYDRNNLDVFHAGIDAKAHYNSNGWHEGRDPDPLFSTNGYLAVNPDVKAAAINPLQHYDAFGWKEGRDPGANFDTEFYLLHAPDVKAAHIDPLAHYLQNGIDEGRATSPAVGNTMQQGGFDAEYYLLANPDVVAAHVDPLQHYNSNGHSELRNPNGYFDAAGYLANNPDVAAAHVDPYQHYETNGWKEGRNPSTLFDTSAYLAANPDVAAAHINPLDHFLTNGIHEGRMPLGDGLWF